MLARTLILCVAVATVGCVQTIGGPVPHGAAEAFPAGVHRRIPPGTSLSDAERVLRLSDFRASGRPGLDPVSKMTTFPARYVRDDGLVQTYYDVVLYADESGVQKVETRQSLGSALDRFVK